MEIRITIDETFTIEDDDLRDMGFEEWIHHNLNIGDLCFEIEVA